MNGLMAALIRRSPTLGGVVMANKGDEWFYLEWLAKTRTVHLDRTAHTYQRVEEYRIKTHEFRAHPDHTAVVRHCTNGYKKSAFGLLSRNDDSERKP